MDQKSVSHVSVSISYPIRTYKNRGTNNNYQDENSNKSSRRLNKSDHPTRDVDTNATAVVVVVVIARGHVTIR